MPRDSRRWRRSGPRSLGARAGRRGGGPRPPGRPSTTAPADRPPGAVPNIDHNRLDHPAARHASCRVAADVPGAPVIRTRISPARSRSSPRRRQGPPQPVPHRHTWFPHPISCLARNVRPPAAGVVLGNGAKTTPGTAQCRGPAGELEHGDLFGVAMLTCRAPSSRRGGSGPRPVVDVLELRVWLPSP
jgi:hypothetical protein